MAATKTRAQTFMYEDRGADSCFCQCRCETRHTVMLTNFDLQIASLQASPIWTFVPYVPAGRALI